jgi:hypothetical protein
MAKVGQAESCTHMIGLMLFLFLGAGQKQAAPKPKVSNCASSHADDEPCTPVVAGTPPTTMQYLLAEPYRNDGILHEGIHQPKVTMQYATKPYPYDYDYAIQPMPNGTGWSAMLLTGNETEQPSVQISDPKRALMCTGNLLNDNEGKMIGFTVVCLDKTASLPRKRKNNTVYKPVLCPVY